MSCQINFFKTSLGKKYVMAVSGLAWSLFVLSHMLGNLLIFCGPESYNLYSHFLISNKLIYIAEAGLIFFFLAHIIAAVSLTHDNKRAKPVGYQVCASGDVKASFASKTMTYQGMLLLAFIVYHLITFKFGTVYMANYDGQQVRDLHRLVIEVFQSPAYVVWYLVCLGLLGLHLSHGFASSFQSFGIFSEKWTPLLKKFGVVYALIVSIGFMAAPIYIFLSKG